MPVFVRCWGSIRSEVRPRAFPVFQEVTLEPPAMGTHFSGLSLKKWSPGRAALVMYRHFENLLVRSRRDTRIQKIIVFMYHKNGCKHRHV